MTAEKLEEILGAMLRMMLLVSLGLGFAISLGVILGIERVKDAPELTTTDRFELGMTEGMAIGLVLFIVAFALYYLWSKGGEEVVEEPGAAPIPKTRGEMITALEDRIQALDNALVVLKGDEYWRTDRAREELQTFLNWAEDREGA